VLSIIPHYTIIVCPNCGLVQYIIEGQKTRKCPNSKCKKTIDLRRVIVYGRTSDIQKAIVMVQKIKEKNHHLEKMKDIRPILDEEDDES